LAILAETLGLRAGGRSDIFDRGAGSLDVCFVIEIANEQVTLFEEALTQRLVFHVNQSVRILIAVHWIDGRSDDRLLRKHL
jgi:hypothetical protein